MAGGPRGPGRPTNRLASFGHPSHTPPTFDGRARNPHSAPISTTIGWMGTSPTFDARPSATLTAATCFSIPSR